MNCRKLLNDGKTGRDTANSVVVVIADVVVVVVDVDVDVVVVVVVFCSTCCC